MLQIPRRQQRATFVVNKGRPLAKRIDARLALFGRPAGAVSA
jgi:hypothetical protein